MRQIFLFLLIALAFSACKNETSNANQTPATPAATDGPVTKCYLMAVGKDSTTVSLTTSPDGNVKGEMNYHPFEKDGGYGTLAGFQKDGKFMCIWIYTIEGSDQKEEVHFGMEGDKLVRYIYELEDKNGMLRPKDTTKPLRTDKFETVNCK